MSIYPKRITSDEQVVIHIKIVNEDIKVKHCKMVTYIVKPNKKITELAQKFFVISNKEKEFYFTYVPKKNDIPGKYLVKTNLYTNGNISHSLTSKNDFFYIDKLSILSVDEDKDNLTISIKNKSSEKTPFELFDNDNTKKDIIDGLNEKKYMFKKSNFPIVLCYANNYCENISKTVEVYAKKQDYKWRVDNNNLIVYNEKKSYVLDNSLGWVWLSCDGIKDIQMLAEELELNKKDLKKYIKKLINIKLLEKIERR